LTITYGEALNESYAAVPRSENERKRDNDARFMRRERNPHETQHFLGSVAEVLLAFLKVLKSQVLANRYQHIWHTIVSFTDLIFAFLPSL